MKKNETNHAAYKLLFPAGCLAAILGVSLWLLFNTQKLNWFPREAHANIMFLGFLWSFVAGFMMTAIPRMTQTETPSLNMQLTAIALVFLQLIFNLFNLTAAAVWIYSAQIIFLILFVGRRFFIRPRIPFEGFLFVPFAFASALIGTCLKALNIIDSSTFYLIACEMFLLNLIMGLGSRLIPLFCRIPDTISQNFLNQKVNLRPLLLLALALNCGYVLQLLGSHDLGVGLRLAVILYHAINNLGWLKRGTTFTMLSVGLKLGIGFLVFSHILQFSFFNVSIAAHHLLYIGSFALITLMIGVRISLAHGGHDLDYEFKSPRIAGIALLFTSAALMRWQCATNYQGAMMAVAAVTFIIAIVLWLMPHYGKKSL